LGKNKKDYGDDACEIIMRRPGIRGLSLRKRERKKEKFEIPGSKKTGLSKQP